MARALYARSAMAISSERLVFRSWRAEDFDLAMRLWGDPRVTTLIDASGALDPDRVRERLFAELEREEKFRVQYWPMFLRDSGEFAGCCGLRPRELEKKIYELGFHLCADAWGRGLATEAAEAVVRFAFEELSAASLFAGHNPKNSSSRRVLEKLGFVHTHDELYPPTGLMHPSYELRAPQR